MSSTPSKSIIDAKFGHDVDIIRGASGTNELVHSSGVKLDLGEVSMIYLSGVAALDDDFEVVAKGDVREQTKHILTTIEGILASQGATISDIVRVRVYTVDLTPERFREIHSARAEFFEKEHYPASTLVEVAGLAKDGLLIEIDCDAVVLKDN